ncbi:hypothetical protein CspeluHIS016_0400930 [Cutaneotrichosporon spelunceum]|uniref:protein disulfide-isomerase n=1 Tax=Cutaneotrichosporon spelunceum TaxID=1672016 RepID=A0AAD3TVH0_9TREE|nr:hypothetical protein CspeluHIS016_0400930 [Cutaneotrichosporon spelunceum]
MRLSFKIPTALLGLAALVTASKVVDLDSKNFDKIIGKDKGALIEFYAPWCGHCKNLAPVYEQLADAFDPSKVIIAKTDADGVGKELGSRFAVKGYPTLKWFPAGSLDSDDYNGGRDLESLVTFVEDKSGVKSNIKPPPPPAAMILDGSNFDKVVDGSKNVLVAFTAPWCGHCKNMKPAYERVATAFANEKDVVVAQVNADDMSNKPIAQRYEIRSFPTIKFFPKGSKEPVAYNEGRSEQQFVDYLNAQCGTQRTSSGLLNDAAGKIKELDELAQKYWAELPSREEIYEKAKEYVSTHSAEVDERLRTAGAYYVRAMERIKAKGDAWVAKEQARLSNLLSSSSLADTKLDEIKVKVNVLSAFVAEKAEEIKKELFEEGQKVMNKAKEEGKAKEEL